VGAIPSTQINRSNLSKLWKISQERCLTLRIKLEGNGPPVQSKLPANVVKTFRLSLTGSNLPLSGPPLDEPSPEQPCTANVHPTVAPPPRAAPETGSALARRGRGLSGLPSEGAGRRREGLLYAPSGDCWGDVI
jgi:hypothetical protein